MRLPLPLSRPGNPFCSLYEGKAEVGGSPGSKPVTMVPALPWQQGWCPKHIWMQAGRWIDPRSGP